VVATVFFLTFATVALLARATGGITIDADQANVPPEVLGGLEAT
jgi:hypothetical protein